MRDLIHVPGESVSGLKSAPLTTAVIDGTDGCEFALISRWRPGSERGFYECDGDRSRSRR